MTCVRTGCHIYIEPYSEFAYGDAFEVSGPVHYFRLVQRSFTPLIPRLHFTVHSYESWFDMHSEISTLISTDTINHGYDGKPIMRKVD